MLSAHLSRVANSNVCTEPTTEVTGVSASLVARSFRTGLDAIDWSRLRGASLCWKRRNFAHILADILLTETQQYFVATCKNTLYSAECWRAQMQGICGRLVQKVVGSRFLSFATFIEMEAFLYMSTTFMQ